MARGEMSMSLLIWPFTSTASARSILKCSSTKLKLCWGVTRSARIRTETVFSERVSASRTVTLPR